MTVVFILDSIVGSFLNVCIGRIPNEESVVRPASRCLNCKMPIALRTSLVIPLLVNFQRS